MLIRTRPRIGILDRKSRGRQTGQNSACWSRVSESVDPSESAGSSSQASGSLSPKVGRSNRFPVAPSRTPMFWSGDYLNHRRREYERVRGDPQRTGTESAHRTIERIGDRETRWVEDYLHRISKAIVQEAVAHRCDTIAFEELTGIRERMPGAKNMPAMMSGAIRGRVTS